jgi:hypothetical protein
MNTWETMNQELFQIQNLKPVVKQGTKRHKHRVYGGGYTAAVGNSGIQLGLGALKLKLNSSTE